MLWSRHEDRPLRWLALAFAVLTLILSAWIPASAQAPPALSCEDQRDTFRHGRALAEGEAATLTFQLRVVTKERDELKAKLAEATKPKPEEKK